jgi:signal transduction histidine kinase
VGFTELATDDAPERSLTRHNLEQVLKASRRAKALVQQLLTFSRFSPQERQLIQLYPLVEETLNFLRVSLSETTELHSHIDSIAGAVWADPTQMQQVLMNLCINAAQAVGEQGGVLKVSLKRVAMDGAFAHLHHNLKPGPHARLTVSDTGCGMAQEAMQRIFEPFFTTKPVGGGSGLGLSVVHGIVTSHGGAITVESTPGQGTTFHVYLPLIESTAAAEDIPDEPLP